MLRVLALVPIALGLSSVAPAQRWPAATDGRPAPATPGIRPRDPAAPLPTVATAKRDIWIEGFAPGVCPPIYSREGAPVGPATGDLEKNSFGYVVVGTCR